MLPNKKLAEIFKSKIHLLDQEGLTIEGSLDYLVRNNDWVIKILIIHDNKQYLTKKFLTNEELEEWANDETIIEDYLNCVKINNPELFK